MSTIYTKVKIQTTIFCKEGHIFIGRWKPAELAGTYDDIVGEIMKLHQGEEIGACVVIQDYEGHAKIVVIPGPDVLRTEIEIELVEPDQ